MTRRLVRVGCAGWSISNQHKPFFGPGDSMLARYATRFPVVEVNSSFYRHHQNSTYRRWAAAVPSHFRFSVKLPQRITHELALRGSGPTLDRFLGEVDGLGGKLGGFLLQLPPSLALDARVASTFLRTLRNRSDAAVVCEPRHASWFNAKADALFERFAVTRVAADPARVPAAARLGDDPLWPYWRWHGSPRMYYSAYSDSALVELASLVDQSRSAPTSPWVIFDNTAHGFATVNAARFQELLEAGPEAKARPGRSRA